MSNLSAHRRLIFRVWVYRLALFFGVGELVLVLISWLLTAAMPEMPLRSLLSAGGVRWYFGHFSRELATPSLVNLIVLALAAGSVTASGFGAVLRIAVSTRLAALTTQQRFALYAGCVLLLIELGVMISLTFMPHAVLLSITGQLFPSSFSASIVPVIAFMLTSSSVLYGLLSGRLHGLYEVGQCMTSAGSWFMPLLLLYVLGMEFYHSFIYVFRL